MPGYPSSNEIVAVVPGRLVATTAFITARAESSCPGVSERRSPCTMRCLAMILVLLAAVPLTAVLSNETSVPPTMVPGLNVR